MARFPEMEVSPDEVRSQLQPSDLGASAFEQAGRMVGHFYSQAASDIRQGASQMGRAVVMAGRPVEEWAQEKEKHDNFQAQMQALSLSSNDDMVWQTKAAHVMDPYPNPDHNASDPNSPAMLTPDPFSFSSRAQANVQGYLAHRAQLRNQFAQSINNNEYGLEAFDRHTYSTAQRLNQHFMTEQSKYATLGAANAFEKTTNSLAFASSQNPALLDANLKSLDDAVGTAQHMPGISDVTAGEFSTKVRTLARKHIIETTLISQATSSAQGLAWAHNIVSSGKYQEDIGADTVKLESAFKTAQRGLVADQNQKIKLTKEAQTADMNHTTEQYLADPTKPLLGVYKEQAFLQNPKSGYIDHPDKAKLAFDTIHAYRSFDPKAVSPATDSANRLALFARTKLPITDPQYLSPDDMHKSFDEALINHQIIPSTYDWLNKSTKVAPLPHEIVAANAEVMKGFARTIDPNMNTTDLKSRGASALGAQNILKAQIALENAERDIIAKGGTVQDIQKGLLNPNSPEFFGNQIGQYHTSVDQANAFQAANEKDPNAPAEQHYNFGVVKGWVNHLLGIQDTPSSEATPSPANPQQGFSLNKLGVENDIGSMGVGYSWGKLQPVKGLIWHHTGGDETLAGVEHTLQQRHLGAQFFIDRGGGIHQLLPDGARGRQIKTGWGPKGEGLSNENTVGIEVSAKDDKDVLPVQVAAAKRLAKALGQKYGIDPDTASYGHGEVNPGHKEADEGMTIVNALRAQQVVQVGNVEDLPKLRPGTPFVVTINGRQFRGTAPQPVVPQSE